MSASETTEKARPVTINLDRIADQAKVGVNRAAVFMGLGLNAASNREFRDYQLNKLPVAAAQTGFPIEMVPMEVSDEMLGEFKAEFARWIVGCGLRELLEHYALALDQAHSVGLFALQSTGKAQPGGDLNKIQKDFHLQGLPRKLELLSARLGVAPSRPEHIGSLYKARNCLAHGGLVNPRNADANGELKVRWRAIEIWAEHKESGLKLVGQEMIGREIPAGTGMMVGPVDREKVFKIGERVQFSQQDLWEICYFFMSDCIPTLMQSLIAAFGKLGLPVIDRQKGAPYQAPTA